MTDDKTLRKLCKKNSKITLAYHTERLYCREFTITSYDNGVIWISPLVPTCAEGELSPLFHTNRAAFLINEANNSGLTGNAIIIKDNENNRSDRLGFINERIGLAPYRLVSLSDQKSYISRLHGWVPEEKKVVDTKSLHFWLKAARSKSFPLSAFSVLIGGLFALLEGNFNPYLFVLSFCGGILVHTTANFLSDYHDYINAVDSTQALSTFTGALVMEELEPTKILTAGFISLCSALILTSFLTAARGLSPLVFILIGLLGAATYGWKPIAYKYRGWGETIVGLLMGPLMTMGSYFIQTESLSWPVLLTSLSLGMIIFSVALANNLRDIPDDKRAGIKTLPMKLGVSGTKTLYYTLIFLPFILSALGGVFHPPLLLLLLAFFSLPLAWKAASNLAKTKNSIEDIRARASELDYTVNSIRYYLSYALWTSIGLLLSCFFW